MSEFWNNCLSQFEKELPAQQFQTWIKTLRSEEEGAEGLVQIVAPNRFVMQWVRERYLPRIQELADAFFGEYRPVKLSLGAAPEKMRSTSSSMLEVQNNTAVVDHQASSANGHIGAAALVATRNFSNQTRAERAPEAPREVVRSAAETNREKSRLNPAFTFDSLVTGRANDLARAAAMQVAENPGISYNPLFVYGGVGLGKTHLIHAIGNAVQKANPNAVIRYVHAEDYYADVVRAFQQKAFDSFKRHYRSLDLLLIDDIQFFNNKARTQEEFFYAFNALIEAKKQIIITCDTYPKNIEGVEERLTTRFGWGLTVQIEPPELEMRVAILNKKAESEKVRLPEDVAFMIAKNLRSNVRELEGALKKVLAFARFHNREITLDVAKDALRDLIGAHNRQITLELIQKTVADYYKIKVAEMYSKKRTRAVARPRQVAMWLAKELTDESYPGIGDAFGGRDHTTVMHACRTIADLRMKDDSLNHDLHVLTQVLRS